MNKYTINWIEQSTTSTGKVRATATLQDEQGVVTEGVTIWGDYPNFATLMVGNTTLGDIQIKQNGKYTNKTLYPARTNTLATPPKKSAPSAIQGAIKAKQEGIEKSQTRKEEGIKLAGAARDATLIVTTFYPELTDMSVESREETIRTKVAYWRKYFTDNFGDDPAPF